MNYRLKYEGSQRMLAKAMAQLSEQAALIERARKFEDIFKTDVADALEALCDGKESTAAALMRRAAEKIQALPAPQPSQEKPNPECKGCELGCHQCETI